MPSSISELIQKIEEIRKSLKDNAKYDGYNLSGYGDVDGILNQIKRLLPNEDITPEKFIRRGGNGNVHIDVNWNAINLAVLSTLEFDQNKKECLQYLLGNCEVDFGRDISALFKDDFPHDQLKLFLNMLDNPIPTSQRDPQSYNNNPAAIKKVQFIMQYIDYKKQNREPISNHSQLTNTALSLALEHKAKDEIGQILENLKNLPDAERSNILLQYNIDTRRNFLMQAATEYPDKINDIFELMEDLDPGIQQNILLQLDSNDNNALMLVARHHPEKVPEFVDRLKKIEGFNLKTKTNILSQMDRKRGFGNVLSRAVAREHGVDVVKSILELMVDLPPDEKIKILWSQQLPGGSPLTAAIRHNPNDVPLILEHMKDLPPVTQQKILLQTDSVHGNALLVAIAQKNQSVRHILEHMKNHLGPSQRVDILKAVNDNGNNSLMVSIINSPEAIPLILEHLKDLTEEQQISVLSQVNSENENFLSLAIKKHKPDLIDPILQYVGRLPAPDQELIFKQAYDRGINVPASIRIDQGLYSLREVTVSTRVSQDAGDKQQKINFYLTKFLFALNSGKDADIRDNFRHLVNTAKKHRSSIHFGETASYKDLMNKLSEMGSDKKQCLNRALGLEISDADIYDKKIFKKAIENYDHAKAPAQEADHLSPQGGG